MSKLGVDLQDTERHKNHGARISKWLMRLNQFDFKVEYRPGKHSANVDGMTRQPMDTEGDEHSFDLLPERQTKDKQKTTDLQVD